MQVVLMTREQVLRAVDQGGAALARLVLSLRPVLAARAVRVLARHRQLAHAAGIEADDAVQEMLLRLLGRDGRWLRSWDPTRGMSLNGWVGLLAERFLRALLLRQPRPVCSLVFKGDTRSEHGGAPFARLEARDALLRTVCMLQATSSPRELAVFETLCEREAPVQLMLTPDALYCARSRLSRRLRAALREPQGGAYDVSICQYHAKPARQVLGAAE